MKKKQLSVLLVIALLLSMLPLSSISAAAEKAIGGYATLGAYTPSADAITRKIMFAMPGAWQNSVTADERCGGYAGVYWWGDNAIDAPDRVAGGHGWPGWRMDKETGESGVTNLFSINAPVYGNGEQANGPMLVFNNYLDCGTDDNPHTNPFYEAACQASDFSAQYYSKNDLKKVPHFEKLFRYTYLKQADNCGLDVSNISMDSSSFWEDINRAAAAYLGENWYYLDEEERTYQIDIVFDDQVDDLDFSEYGTYAGNFYNEDLIEDTYPKETPNEDCLAFTFDNMVYVVDLDPDSLKKNALSQKLEFGGGIFFYYGNGEYGTWPTKALNRQFGGVLGNFMDREFDEEAEAGQLIVKSSYLNSDYNEIKAAYDESKIYFDANSAGWKDFSYITFYLYEHGGSEIITWGSKKGHMTNEGNGIWSYDLEAKGYSLNSNKSYGCIFTADWGMQTCDLIIGRECYGDLAYCTGNKVENNVDSNKKSYEVKWKNADPSKYGNPICITSIGNVIGTAFWPGDTAYSMFLKFLSTDDKTSIVNALKYSGKTEQQIIDDTAAALGLSTADIERAIAASGKTFKWSTIKLNATTLTMTAGTTYTLKATIKPSNTSNKTVSWSSSNTAIATVSSSGVITAKKAGTATITAKLSNGKTAKCKVTVKSPGPPTGIKLNTSAVTMTAGTKYTLKATITPSVVNNKTVYWSSGSTSVAAMSGNGVVVAKKAGTATITAKTANGKTAKCKVTVKSPVAPTGIKLNTSAVTITAGKNYTLKATISPSNATNKSVSWSSSNTAVAAMASGGVIVAKKAGTATITAKTANGKKATCKVTVKAAVASPTGIKLNHTSITMTAGTNYTLKATVVPSNAKNKSVYWSSSNSSVASVLSGGVIVAKKAGTATITAKTSNGKKATCKVTVKK